MSVRRYTILSLIGASVAIPILIGASCPAPTTPGIYGLVTTNLNTAISVAPCNAGFVCVNITNSSSIPVKVALYKHNGFDTANKCGTTSLFSCCTNPNSTVACPCPCTGATTGECKLNRDDLFTGCSTDPVTANLYKIDGANYVTLAAAQSAAQQRIRCGDVKTLGAAVSRGGTADDPITAPVDQNGPVYRGETGGVACGGTVLFHIVDINNTNTGSGTADLVTLAIQTQFSQ
jgi:hypothetical protein